MNSDPFIDPAQSLRIENEIDAIERQHNVRMLLTVESGSRAWRFPSTDSDYDVRFIYAHPIEAYLSIDGPPDVIERPIDGLLDISGWDIRKALQLLVRSNAVVAEWLSSPIRYRADAATATRLLALVRETYHLPAVAYHYDRMARRSFDDIRASGHMVRFKSYCYALRPALALRWMRRHSTLPPMALPQLLQGVELDTEVRRGVDALVEIKAASNEDGAGPRRAALDDFIAATLKEPVERFVLSDRADAKARADALFMSIVLPRGLA